MTAATPADETSHSNVLITGAAGFIGSHLSEALIKRGDAVVGVDNFDPYYDPEIKRNNVRELLEHDDFTLIEGDICEPEDIDATFDAADIDRLVHLAARAGVRPSIEDPVAYMKTNVEGTVNVLEACVNNDVDRIVFISSSSVYGATNELPFSEDQDITHPISPYAASKVSGEALCYTYHHLYEMPIVCLRLFTVYGPRQRPDLAINKFVRLLRNGETIPQYGDGSSSRDYTYVEDIVRGIIAALQSDLGYEIINLGSSSPIRLDEMIQVVGEAAGIAPQVEVLPDQPGDVPHTYASIDKAKRLLDWEPQWTLKAGLREFVGWYAGGRAEA